MTKKQHIALLKADTEGLLYRARCISQRLYDFRRTGPAMAFDDVVYYLETALHVWDPGRKVKHELAQEYPQRAWKHRKPLALARETKGRKRTRAHAC